MALLFVWLRCYFTVSPMLLLCTTDVPLAVTVKCELPAAAPEAFVNVIVDEPFPGELNVLGLKLAVTPLGKSETEKVIGELNPPIAAVVTFNVPFADALTVTVLTLGMSVNPGTFIVNVCF